MKDVQCFKNLNEERGGLGPVSLNGRINNLDQPSLWQQLDNLGKTFFESLGRHESCQENKAKIWEKAATGRSEPGI